MHYLFLWQAWKRRIILTFSLILLLREVGMITIAYYIMKSNDHSTVHSTGERYYREGKELLRESWENNNQYSDSSKDWNQSLGFNLSPVFWPSNTLEIAIWDSLPQKERYSITKISRNLFGAHWLPLLKFGNVEYKFAFKKHSLGGPSEQGEINGKLSFRMFGVCSVKTFNEELDKKLAKLIANEIEQSTRK